ncbi:MAG: DUF2065 domain-containing protein [Aestuariivirgaceae bacterium]
MSDLLTAAGLVLVIEGLLYALAPHVTRRMMSAAQEMSDDQLRLGGVVATVLGVGVVWLVRLISLPS